MMTYRLIICKISKGAKIRNRNNQVPEVSRRKNVVTKCNGKRSRNFSRLKTKTINKIKIMSEKGIQ